MPKKKSFTEISAELEPQPLRMPSRKFLYISLGIILTICVLCLAGALAFLPHWISTKQLLTFGAEGHEPGQLYHPSFISVDGNGNIYVADWDDGRINVFDSAGNFLRVISLGDGVNILGMAAAPDGTVYVSYDAIIHQLDAKGKETKTFSYADSKGDLLGDITGIALGADGSLAAADNSGDVLHFDPQGKASLVLERAFNLPSFSSQNELNPNGAPIFSYDVPANSADKNVSVTRDAAGNIYVLGWISAVVLKTDPNGDSLSKFGSFASFPGGWQRGRFDFPDGIAIDSHGRIYVADTS
ncbi:MAG TPA: NHL repeat-containing protein, partial [Anaerolineales bacterium]|nr:NHL repeat-containing protein [Anaerolineales bacterium]